MIATTLTAGLLGLFLGGAPPPPPLMIHGLAVDTVLVQGVVREVGTQRPIVGAWVAVEGSGAAGFTDELGAFALRLPEGLHEVMVGHLGYTTRTARVEVQGGDLIRLDVELSTEPLALAPITVEVRSRVLLRAGYYDRLASGLAGTRITRERIEDERPRAFSDLFFSVPGIRVLHDASGRAQLRSRRAGGSSYGCETTLYIDGFAVNERMNLRANESQLSDVNILSPSTIEAVEVYVGAATPPQYPSRCGVVLVWTRN